jgi:hypothetical protein
MDESGVNKEMIPLYQSMSTGKNSSSTSLRSYSLKERCEEHEVRRGGVGG